MDKFSESILQKIKSDFRKNVLGVSRDREEAVVNKTMEDAFSLGARMALEQRDSIDWDFVLPTKQTQKIFQELKPIFQGAKVIEDAAKLGIESALIEIKNQMDKTK